MIDVKKLQEIQAKPDPKAIEAELVKMVEQQNVLIERSKRNLYNYLLRVGNYPGYSQQHHLGSVKHTAVDELTIAQARKATIEGLIKSLQKKRGK